MKRLAIDERSPVWARLAPGQPLLIWIRGQAKRVDLTGVEDDGFSCGGGLQKQSATTGFASKS